MLNLNHGNLKLYFNGMQCKGNFDRIGVNYYKTNGCAPSIYGCCLQRGRKLAEK